MLVASNEIKVSAVSGETLPVIIEGKNLLVGLWYTPDTLAPTVVAILVLLYVVAEMNNVIDGILPHSIAIGIEEAKWVI